MLEIEIGFGLDAQGLGLGLGLSSGRMSVWVRIRIKSEFAIFDLANLQCSEPCPFNLPLPKGKCLLAPYSG